MHWLSYLYKLFDFINQTIEGKTIEQMLKNKCVKNVEYLIGIVNKYMIL